jgi:probable O-glycosylation ligase (exosortase A-associated)
MALALALRARGRIARLVAWGSVVVLLLAIVGTQSRGATLGLIAVGGYLWLTSKRKLVSMVGILLAGAVITFHASDAYFSRMSTIGNYQQDQSAEGRIIAWKASLRMAADNPLFGVGLGNFPTEFGSKYRPRDRAMPWMTAHSSYFLVLGELGPPGLIVLLALVIGAIRSLLAVKRRLIEACADPPSPEVSEAIRLLNMLVASTIGFAVPGAFLSAAYYPHLFVLTGILVSARCIASGLLPASANGPRPGMVRRRMARPSAATGRQEPQKIPRIRHMNSARDEQADSWTLTRLRHRGSSPFAT